MFQCYIYLMEWQVEYTDEFGRWWDSLNRRERISIASAVELLQNKGPHLPFPYSSGVHASRHSHMRELRVQHDGEPYRVLYAFDPRRVAILLIGGNKGGNDKWYQEYTPIADTLYDVHLDEINRERGK